MKLPKTRKMFCKKCKKHTEHKVSEAKRKGPGSVHTMSYGSKSRVRARGYWKGQGNHGRYGRPAINSRKMYGKKTSKKMDLRFTCNDCKKTSSQRRGVRARKVEFKQ